MNKEVLEILLKANNKYLCELYQYANQKYFVAYVDDNKQAMDYYKEIFSAIGEELRKRNYWSY